MRYAIYFTPRQDVALARIAAKWLGRDPFGASASAAEAVADLSAAEVAFHTASARRYGFHATLKAPFRLADDATEASLRGALDSFAETRPVVTIPHLALRQIDGFFALVPDGPLPLLNRLADDVVREFDRFRAPLSDAEIERRSPDTLKPAEFKNLCRWGYPYVFETFRFHMTLSGRAAPQESPRLRAAIDSLFAEELRQPVAVDALTLFIETEPGAPFTVRSSHALGTGSAPQNRLKTFAGISPAGMTRTT
jgi:putative phosphonate metabolism protein